MSNGTHKGNPDGVVTQITVTLTKSGQVSVSGPIQDKLLCLGMLQTASHIVHDFKPEVRPRVEVAPPEAVNGLLAR